MFKPIYFDKNNSTIAFILLFMFGNTFLLIFSLGSNYKIIDSGLSLESFRGCVYKLIYPLLSADIYCSLILRFVLNQDLLYIYTMIKYPMILLPFYIYIVESIPLIKNSLHVFELYLVGAHSAFLKNFSYLHHLHPIKYYFAGCIHIIFQLAVAYIYCNNFYINSN